VRTAAGAAVDRARRGADVDDDVTVPRPNRRRSGVKLPGDVVAEIVREVGERNAPRLVQKVDDARGAFERERYSDAKRMISVVAKEAPGASAVRELLGLTLYRLEYYRAAGVELQAYATLTGAVDQHPVLADCYRAQRKWAKVEALWAELREESPSAELVAEGRIVTAGARADQGNLQGGIELLEKAPRPKGKVRVHHLREWYVLADLLDRAGETPRARRLFERIVEIDPAFADVVDRLRTLGN